MLLLSTSGVAMACEQRASKRAGKRSMMGILCEPDSVGRSLFSDKLPLCAAWGKVGFNAQSDISCGNRLAINVDFPFWSDQRRQDINMKNLLTRAKD